MNEYLSILGYCMTERRKCVQSANTDPKHDDQVIVTCHACGITWFEDEKNWVSRPVR